MKTFLYLAIAICLIIIAVDAKILADLYTSKKKQVVSEVLRAGAWTANMQSGGRIETGYIVVKEGTLVDLALDWTNRGRPQLEITKDGKRVGVCTALVVRDGILVAVCTGIPDEAILDPELEAKTGTVAGKPALMPTRIHSLRVVEKRRWN